MAFPSSHTSFGLCPWVQTLPQHPVMAEQKGGSCGAGNIAPHGEGTSALTGCSAPCRAAPLKAAGPDFVEQSPLRALLQP